jgi:hypothetical protein
MNYNKIIFCMHYLPALKIHSCMCFSHAAVCPFNLLLPGSLRLQSLLNTFFIEIETDLIHVNEGMSTLLN